MSERPWYKRYPSDFIAGTLGMGLEEKGAYSILLDLIYDRGRPIPDDPRYLAGVCGCSVRKWNAIRQRLIDLGKIVCEGGTISNRRAEKEIETATKIARKLAENGAKGGNKKAENAAATSETNDLALAGPTLTRALQKPEARSQNQKEEPDLPSGDTPLRRPPERLNGLRLPEDWMPTAEQRLYAADHGYSPGEIEAMAEDFRDYWLARSGADARKRDWNRTWRRWVRNQQNFRGGRSNGAKPARTVESDRAAILRGLRLDTEGRSLDGDYPGYSGEAFHRH